MNGITFVGGPLDGETFTSPNEWPLPAEFSLLLHADSDGLGMLVGGYRKVVDAGETPERNALYEWAEPEDTTMPSHATEVVVTGEPRQPWNEATGEGVELA